jgi:hypothetical protein
LLGYLRCAGSDADNARLRARQFSLRCRRRLLGYRSSGAEDELATMYEGHMISVLSGGRKRRRRHYMLTAPLWPAAVAFASFVAVALVLVRI